MPSSLATSFFPEPIADTCQASVCMQPLHALGSYMRRAFIVHAGAYPAGFGWRQGLWPGAVRIGD